MKKVLLTIEIILLGLLLLGIGYLLFNPGETKENPQQTIVEQEQSTGEEKKEPELPPLDWSKLKVKGQKGLYDLSSLWKKSWNLVAAGAGGEEELILVGEKKGETKKKGIRTIYRLSLKTGVTEELLSHEIKMGKDYIGYLNYTALSYQPLVLYNDMTASYEIYKEDYSGVAQVTIKGAMPNVAQYSAKENCLYYTKEGEMALMKVSLADLAYQGEHTELSEKAELLWRPDVNFGDCQLERISEDGRYARINAHDMNKKKNVTLVYDLENQEKMKYVTVKGEEYYPWQSFDRRRAVNQIYSEDGKKETIQYIDLDEDTKYSCRIKVPNLSWHEFKSECVLSNGKILLQQCKDGKKYLQKILIWDYKSAKKKSYTKELKYKEKELEEEEVDYGDLTIKAEKLEEKYGVEILLGKNCKSQFDSYTAKAVTNRKKIKNALNALENALEFYPQGIFKEIEEGYCSSISILLTGKLTALDSSENIDSAAFVQHSGGHVIMVVDIENFFIEPNIIHEVSHIIDYWYLHKGYIEKYEKKWNGCNPKGFEYYNSYFGYEGDIKNTTWSEEFMLGNTDTAWFIDDYAKTYDTEDRARLIENFYSLETYNSKHLDKKLKVYITALDEYFECVTMESDCDLMREYKKMTKK